MCVLVVPADSATVVDRICVELGLDWAGEISGRLDDSDRVRGAGEFGSLAEGGSLVRLVRPG